MIIGLQVAHAQKSPAERCAIARALLKRFLKLHDKHASTIDEVLDDATRRRLSDLIQETADELAVSVREDSKR